MEAHEFNQNKKDILQKVSEQLGRKVYDGEVVVKNEYFTKLEESIPMWRSEIPDLRIESNEIFTLVEKKRGYYLKVQPFISLHLPDFSVIRFSPYKDNGLEISRIQTPIIGRGNGSKLMEIFFSIVRGTLDFVPMIWLECTGTVGINQTELNYGISNQTQFFRKFGFRVKDRSQYPRWVDMIRPEEKNVSPIE
jgi:hypothetical protein